MAGQALAAARFGLLALRSTRRLADARFTDVEAKSLLAGMSGRAFLPIEVALRHLRPFVTRLLPKASSLPGSDRPA